MSTLLNKFVKFYKAKLSTRGRGVKKGQKSVNIVCEHPLISICKVESVLQRIS